MMGMDAKANGKVGVGIDTLQRKMKDLLTGIEVIEEDGGGLVTLFSFSLSTQTKSV